MKWMRALPWLGVFVVPSAAACNYTEGECYLRGQGGWSAGEGGGIIVPNGAGGFGEVPPGPQSTEDSPPPDCNIVKDTACNERCLKDYEKAAEECTKVQTGAQRDACNDAAYAAHKSCRGSCQTVTNECYNKCDEKAAEGHKKCDGVSDAPGRAKCRQAVEEQREACYRECNQK